MKTKLINLAIIGLTIACLGNTSHAAIISGTHYTAGGKEVALQGLEWLSLEHTAGLSRDYIEGGTGFIDRYGTEWAAGDWQYATREQTETLLNSLWDGVYNGWSNGNYDGAYWFANQFQMLGYDVGFGQARVDNQNSSSPYTGYDYSNFIFGGDYECSSRVWAACYGEVAIGNVGDSFAAYNVVTQTYVQQTGLFGDFADSSGTNAGLTTINWFIDKSNSSPFIGSLLVRSNDTSGDNPTIDAPPNFAMFALGLLGLAALRRKNK